MVADDDNLYCRHEAVAGYLFTKLNDSDRHSKRCLSKATDQWNHANMLLFSKGLHYLKSRIKLSQKNGVTSSYEEYFPQNFFLS